MKKLITAIAVTILFSLRAFAADGDLDLTFNTTGSRVTDVSTASNDVIFDIGVLSDGRIVGMGGANGQTAAIRYLTGGGLDTAFSGDGIATAFTGTGNAGAVQADGRIVVAGSIAGNLIHIVRYTATGAIDTSFAGDGQVTVNVGGNQIPNARAVLIQPDGKIIIGGTANSSTGDLRDPFLIRLATDGSLDTTFGSGGIAIIDLTPGAVETLAEAVLTDDGKIVFAGFRNDGVGFSDVLVARFNSDGTPDASFDADGWTTIPIEANNNDQAESLALAPGGKIVVGGIFTSIAVTNGPVMLRLNANGSLDATFDGDGILFPAVRSTALLVQPDGRILAVGPATTTTYRLSKFNSNGTLDTSFSTDGFTNAAGAATSLALQPDGKILVAGSQLASAGNQAFFMTRFQNTSLTPTSAGIAVAGRVVTPDGRGLRGALVYLRLQDGAIRAARTGASGYFRFADLAAGQDAVLSIASRKFAFAPRVVSLADEVTDLVVSPAVTNAAAAPGAAK